MRSLSVVQRGRRRTGVVYGDGVDLLDSEHVYAGGGGRFNRYVCPISGPCMCSPSHEQRRPVPVTPYVLCFQDNDLENGWMNFYPLGPLFTSLHTIFIMGSDKMHFHASVYK